MVKVKSSIMSNKHQVAYKNRPDNTQNCFKTRWRKWENQNQRKIAKNQFLTDNQINLYKDLPAI